MWKVLVLNADRNEWSPVSVHTSESFAQHMAALYRLTWTAREYMVVHVDVSANYM